MANSLLIDNLVQITVDGEYISVDQEPADVSTLDTKPEQVVWVGPEGFDFDIVFTGGSPFFGGHVFHSDPVTKRAESGRAKPGTGNGRTYKYVIVPRNSSTVRPLDPTIRPRP